jgi:hypothetical protein
VARDFFDALSADEQLEVACIYKALFNEPRRQKRQVHFEHFRDLLTRWCDLMTNNESEEDLQ